jgi:hypothetical protein
MKADFTPQSGYRRRLKVLYPYHGMGHARIDVTQADGLAGHLDSSPGLHVKGVRHSYFDLLTGHFSGNDTGGGGKSHFFPGNPIQIGKSRGATGAIAAHFSQTAVRVEKPPFKIDILALFYQDQAVSPYRELSLADFTDQRLQAIIIYLGLTVIDDDEIITAATHFKKGKGWHLLSS